MGLLDSFLGPSMGGTLQPGQGQSLANAVMKLLGNQSAGGLGGLLNTFTQQGFGSQVQSWIGTGPNQAVTPEQIRSALGEEKVAQIAREAGVEPNNASVGLSQLIPGLVDRLTPQGTLPQGNDLEQQIAGLRRLFS